MQSSNIEIPLIISVSRGKSPGEVLLIAWLNHFYLFKMFYNRAIILISRQWASDEIRVYLAMLNYRKYITLGNQIITTFKPYGILETFSLFIISFYWLTCIRFVLFQLLCQSHDVPAIVVVVKSNSLKSTTTCIYFTSGFDIYVYLVWSWRSFDSIDKK